MNETEQRGETTPVGATLTYTPIMNAIYKGKLYSIVDDCTNMVDLLSVDDDTRLSVLWSDPSLIIDPTDDEINNIPAGLL